VNDNPDQAKVVHESGAGLCVPLDAESFARAVTSLLDNPAMCAQMAGKGSAYIADTRGYDKLAARVHAVYSGLLCAAQA